MSKTVFEKKRELYKKWNELKRLGNSEDLTFDQFFKIRNEEQEYYDKWKFLDSYTKAKEKISYEKKKKN